MFGSRIARHGAANHGEMATTSVALQDQLTKNRMLKNYADSSTAAVLDMIRVKKNDMMKNTNIKTQNVWQ